jgi:hypothetical protein
MVSNRRNEELEGINRGCKTQVVRAGKAFEASGFALRAACIGKFAIL